MSLETTSGEPTLAPGNTALGDTWVTFKRWLTKNLRNSHVVGFSILQPVVYYVLFTAVFGQIANGVLTASGGNIGYATFLLPAIVILVALTAASSSGTWLVNDIESGMFAKTLASPMRRVPVFLGKTLAEVVMVAAQIVLVLVVGVLLGAEIKTGVLGALAIIGIGLVFSFWFIALSNVLGLQTKNTQATVLIVTFFQLPLLFLSNAFLPIEILPEWIQFIAAINPITYGVKAVRTLAIEGWVWDTILPSLGVLIALDIVFVAIAVYFLNRASSASVR